MATSYGDGDPPDVEDLEEAAEEPIDYDELDEIVEVFGQLPWASPSDLERITIRLEREPDLRKVLSAFRNPRALQRALAIGWLFILGQIEYRVKTHSSVYVFVYGTRGIGKSEVGQYIALITRKSYLKYLGRNHELAFGRSASDLNQHLKKATKEGVSIILISDEAEEETGTGSATEEQALVGNLDTMRVLMHSVIRCAITLRWTFASRCDFILEPIYQDRENRVNYCVVYTIDPEKQKKVAKYIVDIPLHDDERLRRAYEEWKRREQKEFTSKGGRRSRLKKRLAPIVRDLVKIARERGLQPRSWKAFEHLLVFAVDGGETLTGRESYLACKEAFDVYTQTRPERSDRGPPVVGYTGPVDDLRDAIYRRLEELGFDPADIDMLKRYAGGESQTDIAYHYGTTQKTVSMRIKRLRENPLALGKAFEDVYAQLLRTQGFKVVQGGGNSPEPDIIVYDQDGNMLKVLSAKCYCDKRVTLTVPRHEIGEKEWEVSRANGVPLYLVFYDLVEGRLHEPVLVEDQLNFTFRKSPNWIREWKRQAGMRR